MEKKMKIIVSGKEYPCYITCGALRRFKRMTGMDVSALTGGDVDDVITLIYCCTASACNKEGVAFDLTIEDFADCLEIESMRGFVQDMSSGADDTQKKTEERSLT